MHSYSGPATITIGGRTLECRDVRIDYGMSEHCEPKPLPKPITWTVDCVMQMRPGSWKAIQRMLRRPRDRYAPHPSRVRRMVARECTRLIRARGDGWSGTSDLLQAEANVCARLVAERVEWRNFGRTVS